MNTRASPPIPTVDLTDILRTLAMFFPTGQVTELRALDVSTKQWPRPHVVSGYLAQTQHS